MRRVVIVCEGQTEESFISRVLVPAFADAGLHLQGITIETSPGHKGGALSYGRLRPALRNALVSPRVAAVSTLIDLYGLSTDFPGHSGAMAQFGIGAKLGTLEAALHADVIQHSGADPARFIAHIQPHEFEALLFSDVSALSEVEAGWTPSLGALDQARAGAATPEHINGGHDTKPSARLQSLLRGPSYRKVRHGPIAAERIGLARMEAECPHFAAWLARLRQV